MRTQKSIFFVLFILILLILLFNLEITSNKFRNFFYLISSPIQRFFWKAGDRVSDFWAGIFQAEKIKEENEKLRLENKDLLKEITSLREIRNENLKLREILGLGLEDDFDLTLTNIIGREILKDSLIVDKGLNDGIKKDFPAITEKGILCGKVSEIFDNFSRIQLLTDKGSSITVKISNLEEVIFKAQGIGNSKISLELIPKNLVLNEGDLVITSAEGGIFPKGLFVGKISSIEKSDLDPFQKAQIEPACQIEEIENLFLIKKW